VATKPIPEGFHSVTPYLAINGARAAIDFYKKAFGATEMMCLNMPDGKIGHAEIRIGDSPVMLSDAFAEWGTKGPDSYGGTPVSMCIYVPDVDATVAQATAAGAKVTMPLADQFYGDRSARLQDPFGHVWHIATHKEDMSPQEMQRRMDEWMKQQAKA
jgi:PhnB protein